MTDDDDRIAGLEKLPMTRTPERDLWPGIEARILRRRRLWLPAALAASVVAGLATVIGLSLLPAEGDRTVVVATDAPRLPLTRDARAIVEANLGLVQGAERQLRQALEQDPDSPALLAMLASAEDRQRTLRRML